MTKMIRGFLQDEGGATAIEYGLIIALVALAIVGGVGSFGDQLEYLWGDNNGKIQQGLSTH
ncbi:Flp family type IVb pilin [Mesorhizobium sp. LHD-90]|uniref:Flp family type IVb pilin n=1 Tax=Mesorhizobium sp. LHD-90 TaxID=3071414 RepID=UPI0027DEB918|nr:Flp family type IVb pilin [Mesorhizobium sp. LHD-90]MDQ6432718.1 Flp family type IVb pilin [Mesorhizobium sp. LHD-90]